MKRRIALGAALLACVMYLTGCVSVSAEQPSLQDTARNHEAETTMENTSSEELKLESMGEAQSETLKEEQTESLKEEQSESLKEEQIESVEATQPAVKYLDIPDYPELQLDVPQSILAVFNGDGTFIDAGTGETFTRDSFDILEPDSGDGVATYRDLTMWMEYKVLDLDGDGVNELAFGYKWRILGAHELIAIFHEINGIVYAYRPPIRGFGRYIKPNYIHGSSGASFYGYYIYTFDEQGYQFNEVVEVHGDEARIGETPVTVEEARAYMDALGEDVVIDWTEYRK